MSWPAWATEGIALHEPDEAWPARAGEFRDELRELLAPWLVGPVEHVGSTAVPGLAAKPIIDLMAPVAVLADAAGADGALAEAGWHLVPPELDQRPWRRFFVLPEGDRRVAHLQIVEREHPRWEQTLRFRDALRASPDLAREYAELKRALSSEHPDDREAYTAAKAAFVERVVAGAS